MRHAAATEVFQPLAEAFDWRWPAVATGALLQPASAGDDEMSGSPGDDTLDGEAGNDTVKGNDGQDSLLGGTGNDALFGSAGNDTVLGGADDDTLNGGTGNDLLDGGAGHDLAVYGFALLERPVVFDASAVGSADVATLQDGQGGTDTVQGVEWLSIEGGDFNDQLTGSMLLDLMIGGAGNDTLNGGAGHDELLGSDGQDALQGNGGNDQLKGGNGADALVGGKGQDSLLGGDAADALTGGSGADRLTGGAGNDSLSGGSGNDRLVLDSLTGSDTLSDFASGSDRVVISQSSIPVGNGDTTLSGAVKLAGPGGFSASAELVIVSANITGAITKASAAAQIGSAGSAYAVGQDALFAVDNGSSTALYLFSAADANALVSSSELTLLATLSGTAATAVADYLFGS